MIDGAVLTDGDDDDYPAVAAAAGAREKATRREQMKKKHTCCASLSTFFCPDFSALKFFLTNHSEILRIVVRERGGVLPMHFPLLAFLVRVALVPVVFELSQLSIDVFFGWDFPRFQSSDGVFDGGVFREGLQVEELWRARGVVFDNHAGFGDEERVEDVVAERSGLVFEDVVGGVWDGFTSDGFFFLSLGRRLVVVSAQGGQDVFEIFFVHELRMFASVHGGVTFNFFENLEVFVRGWNFE